MPNTQTYLRDVLIETSEGANWGKQGRREWRKAEAGAADTVWS